MRGPKGIEQLSRVIEGSISALKGRKLLRQGSTTRLHNKYPQPEAAYAINENKT